MDDLNDHRYKLSRVLLSFVGLWPYEDTHFTRFKRVFSVLILASSIFFQFVTLFRTPNYNRKQLLNTVTCVVVISLFLHKWCIYWYNLNGIEKMIDMMRDNWRSMNNENDQKIILKYIDRATFINRIIACIIYLSMCCFLIYEMPRPNYSEASLGTKSMDLHIELNYFSDKKIYSYVAYFHEYTTIVIGFTTLIGTEITTMLLSHYASGLFGVVRYRIQNACQDEVVKSSIFERNRVVRARLIIAVKIHKTALQYYKTLDGTLGFSYLTLLIMGVFSLSLNLLSLAQVRLQANKLTTVMMEIVIVLAHFFYLFLPNHIGQIIIDSSTNLFTSAYHSQWYLTAVPEQKLFLFIQHRNLKNWSIDVGGLFTPSYEGFSTLVKMSFSYFTVIYSTQS